MSSTKLSVNLNKIALLRNSRGSTTPDIGAAAHLVLEAGADGITLHPRPDARHATAHDVAICREVCDHYGAELNVEGNPFATANAHYPGMLTIARESNPDQVTFVPDTDSQLTSDHGWRVAELDNDTASSLQTMLDSCHKLGQRTSLFMDPSLDAVQQLTQLSALPDRIEIYTYDWAHNFGNFGNNTQHQSDRKAIQQVLAWCQEHGIAVNAGHDLNLENLSELLSLGEIAEVSIGHALISEALFAGGLSHCVQAYRKLIDRG